MTELYVDQMQKSPDHKVRLMRKGDSGFFVTGTLAHDLEPTFSAEWTNIYQATNAAVGAAESIIGGAREIAGNTEFMTFRSPMLSRMRWDGSGLVDIPISLNFFATQDGKNDVLKKVALLTSALYPNLRKGGKIIDSNSIEVSSPDYFVPPGVKDGSSSGGELQLMIGDWFVVTSPGLFLASAQPSISAKIGTDRKPIFARVDIVLRTIQVPTAQEIREWYKVPAETDGGVK